ncbi:MAG: 50S ribosomal protein L13 [Candidatus Woesearchaeota archaeon]
MIIINGENLIVGRVATVAAKKSLLGEDIKIVNCEKMFITGDKAYRVQESHRRRAQGTWSKGPFFYRMPDRYVKRIIRGMLPYKTPRGTVAYKRILCYMGMPEEFKNEKLITIENASIKNIPNLKYMSVGDIAKHMGAKV